jgi:hypothetical protein
MFGSLPIWNLEYCIVVDGQLLWAWVQSFMSIGRELKQRLFWSYFSQAFDWSAAVRGFMIYGIGLRFASQQLRRKSFGLTSASAHVLYRRCLTPYVGSSATRAARASRRASTMTDKHWRCLTCSHNAKYLSLRCSLLNTKCCKFMADHFDTLQIFFNSLILQL